MNIKPFQLNPRYYKPAFPSTWADLDLFGKPKEILTSTFQEEIINGKIEQYRFHSKGLLMESNELFPSKKLYKQELYQYNQNDKLIQIKESNSSGSLMCKFTFQYDHFDLLTHYQCTEYGQVDHIIEEEKLEYFFHSDGKLNKVIRRWIGEESEFFFTADQKIDYIIQRSNTSRQNFAYSDEGQQITTIDLKTNNLLMVERIRFDEKMRVTHLERYNSSHQLVTGEYSTYNQQGHLIEYKMKTQDEVQPVYDDRYQYKYDEYGNWIEKLVINTPIRYIRAIKYF